jgi:hypothetical protein
VCTFVYLRETSGLVFDWPSYLFPSLPPSSPPHIATFVSLHWPSATSNCAFEVVQKTQSKQSTLARRCLRRHTQVSNIPPSLRLLISPGLFHHIYYIYAFRSLKKNNKITKKKSKQRPQVLAVAIIKGTQLDNLENYKPS